MPNIYENLDFSWVDAISELVDNSISSYEIHKSELPNGIDVNIEISKRQVRITDNAFGMDRETLEAILGPFGFPENVTQKATIGTYGAGIVSACSWIGSRWSVRTARAGEDIVLILPVDASKFTEEVACKEIGERSNRGFEDGQGFGVGWTEIVVKHPRRLSPRQGAKLRSDLSLNFSEFIDEGILRMMLNGKEVLSHRPVFMNGTFSEFTLAEVEGVPIRVEIGILKPHWDSSPSVRRANRLHRGITTLWRGRVVERGLLNAALGNSPSDLAHQRICCRIHLDCLNLASSKNSFVWEPITPDDLIEMLSKNSIFRHCVETARKMRKFPKADYEEE